MSLNKSGIEWYLWRCRDCGKKVLFEFGIDDPSLPMVCDLCGGTCRAVRHEQLPWEVKP